MGMRKQKLVEVPMEIVDATAVPEDVRKGKVFYNNLGRQEGVGAIGCEEHTAYFDIRGMKITQSTPKMQAYVPTNNIDIFEKKELTNYKMHVFFQRKVSNNCIVEVTLPESQVYEYFHISYHINEKTIPDFHYIDNYRIPLDYGNAGDGFLGYFIYNNILYVCMIYHSSTTSTSDFGFTPKLLNIKIANLN